MELFVSVNRGRFEISGHGCDGVLRFFEPNQVGLREMAAFFDEEDAGGAVMCSSSVDYCHEYGFEYGFDAGNFVGVALALADGVEGAKMAALSYDTGLKSTVWN